MIELIDRDFDPEFDETHTLRGDRSLGAIRSAIYTLALGSVAFAIAGYLAWLKGLSLWLIASLAFILIGSALLSRGGRRVADFSRDSKEVSGILEQTVDDSEATSGTGAWHTLNLRVREGRINVLYRFDVGSEMFTRLSKGDEITVNCSPVFRAIRWIRIESRPCANCGERVSVSEPACRACEVGIASDAGLKAHTEIEDDSQWRRPPMQV